MTILHHIGANSHTCWSDAITWVHEWLGSNPNPEP